MGDYPTQEGPLSQNWPEWQDQKHNRVRAIRIVGIKDHTFYSTQNDPGLDDNTVKLEDESEYHLNDQMQERGVRVFDYLVEKEGGEVSLIDSNTFEGAYARIDAKVLRGDYTDAKDQEPRV